MLMQVNKQFVCDIFVACSYVVGPDLPSFSRLKLDSRTLGNGDVFVALVGPNNDGHDFIADAIERGAVACVIARNRAEKFMRCLSRLEKECLCSYCR